jgi:DNA topoisomerase-1
VHLGAGSWVKGQNDRLKYEKARKLKGKIQEIRDHYEQFLNSSKDYRRECGTIVYMIDRLALRVGNDKDDEEEADTVGCCSLRHEHIKFPDRDTVEKFNQEANKGPYIEGEHYVELDFLGKDSIRYHNIFTVPENVKRNLADFKRRTEEGEMIFTLEPGDINDYLKRFMKELSAKVFRTYNASNTLQQELAKFEALGEADIDKHDDTKVLKFYNEANRQVAILCNHQKTASSEFEANLQKAKDKVEELREELEDAKNQMKKQKKKDDSAYEKTAKKVEKMKQQLEKQETTVKMKEDNKSVALGTSKINYMDPRISVAFCKRANLPVEKIFTGALRTKFPWAMHARSTWEF